MPLIKLINRRRHDPSQKARGTFGTGVVVYATCAAPTTYNNTMYHVLSATARPPFLWEYLKVPLHSLVSDQRQQWLMVHERAWCLILMSDVWCLRIISHATPHTDGRINSMMVCKELAVV